MIPQWNKVSVKCLSLSKSTKSVSTDLYLYNNTLYFSVVGIMDKKKKNQISYWIVLHKCLF